MFAITDTDAQAAALAEKARAWCGETSWTLATHTATA
jgi:hypothetical protein